jgi:hypothetical protein
MQNYIEGALGQMASLRVVRAMRQVGEAIWIGHCRIESAC